MRGNASLVGIVEFPMNALSVNLRIIMRKRAISLSKACGSIVRLISRACGSMSSAASVLYALSIEDRLGIVINFLRSEELSYH